MELILRTDEEFSKMQQLFASELARKHDRSTTTIENAGGKAAFHITAKDTTALRAAFNTVTSVLGMHEKTTEAINGGK